MELLGSSSAAPQELTHPTPEASEAHAPKPGGLSLPLLAWPLRKHGTHKIEECIASFRTHSQGSPLSDPQPGAAPFGPTAKLSPANTHLVTRAP